ncbi:MULTISPECIES: hypothetical protein [unclassified Bradyrhizobium]|uniref:hypothetical protein n=1 Tax=unclassified Bradyrhizobium TaxID=2631580 RepID=UPI0028ED04BE|nr:MULTISPECIES: hypothetical protein [unclassified Bradyrhizobium]
MDKAEFVARAPIYYALAIAVALHEASTPLPEFKIKGRYPDLDDPNPEGGSLIERWMIWDRAVAWLVKREMIKIKRDPFGPAIFSSSPEFDDVWNTLIQDEDLPFSTYEAAGRSNDWLVPALISLENHFVNLDIKVLDFENPDGEWAPIQLEEDDPTAKKAISSLENVIEEVRSDNGYSATHSQERDFALEGLQGTLNKLRSRIVSAGYVKIALERLGMLGKRFAGTIKEGTIAAARAALIDFAKAHFGDALNYVWKIFF